MRKFSLSLLFALMLFGMFAAAASAAGELTSPDTTNSTGLQNGTMTPGTKGTSITNANDTANGVDVNDGSTVGTVNKALTGQHVHTSYQNNTNSCASCHQTHTAKGAKLLFADGVYQTCSACHDGTLGYLNVFDAPTATSDTAETMTGGGTFAGTHGASMHMSNEAVKISAAPGGNPAVQVADATGNTSDKRFGTEWGENFDCASCHAPHGSYSDRLLAYNPNGIGAMPASQGGMQLENVPVVDTLPADLPASPTQAEKDAFAAEPAVVLYRTTDGTSGVVTVAQYNKGASTYAKTTAPWLYGYDNRTDGKTYYSRLMKDATTVAAYGSTAGVYFDYQNAQAYSIDKDGATAGADALKAATTGFIARPVIVKMAKNGYDVIQSAYYSGADISKFKNLEGTVYSAQQLKDFGYKVDGTTNVVTNVGVQMSKFCAACHTDYLTASGTKSSHFGDANSATAAYRHSTNSDSYTCVRCHYGHGTDAYIMKDSLGRTIKDLIATGGKFAGDETAALNYMQDNNKSSALKKYTNMSICWACHNSSHAETIKNTERSADHPTGAPTGF